MPAAEPGVMTYRACPIKRDRRTKAEVEAILEAIFDVDLGRSPDDRAPSLLSVGRARRDREDRGAISGNGHPLDDGDADRRRASFRLGSGRKPPRPHHVNVRQSRRRPRRSALAFVQSWFAHPRVAIMTGTISADTHEVREFVETYIAQARVNPTDDDVTSVYRYALDDPRLAERMISDAVNASAGGHNVYVEGRTVRAGLNGKQRGELNDTVAVFALTVDSDSDKEKAWTPTVPTSLAVETSPNNAHYWFFLDKALDPKPAKALRDRLRAATGADSDTGNICQPYRLAGTVNYPSKKKRERGRVVVSTRSLGFDPETLWNPERFEQEFP